VLIVFDYRVSPSITISKTELNRTRNLISLSTRTQNQQLQLNLSQLTKHGGAPSSVTEGGTGDGQSLPQLLRKLQGNI
jgi:hypothetical protein